jgi:hypothetical protein
MIAKMKQEKNNLENELVKQKKKIKENQDELNNKEQKLNEQSSKLSLLQDEKQKYLNKIKEYELKLGELKENMKKTEQNLLNANKGAENEKKLELEIKKMKEDFEKQKHNLKKEWGQLLSNKYNQEIITQLDKMKKAFKDKLEEKTARLENDFKLKFEQKENEMQKKYDEMSEIIMKSGIQKKDDINYNARNKYNNPNFNNIFGVGDFPKNKQMNNSDNEEDDDYNIIEKGKDVNYSYECTNSLILINIIYEGTDECKFQLNLKNNGKDKWPEDSKLEFDNNSQGFGENIRLRPQKPGESSNYTAILKGLGNKHIGDYRFYLWFSSNGKKYGDKLLLKVSIKNKPNKDEISEEDMEKVKEFRDNFGIPEDEFDDQKIIDVLKENNFNHEKAFEELFN